MGLDPPRPYFMQVRMKADSKTFLEVVAATAEDQADSNDLVYPGQVPHAD